MLVDNFAPPKSRSFWFFPTAEVVVPAPTLTRVFLQSNSVGVNITEYTFLAENFGAADSLRDIVCLIASEGGAPDRTIVSVTIGGVSATIDIQRTGVYAIVGIARATVPTGTSGDVVITFSDSMRRTGIALWSLIPDSGSGVEVVATDSADASTASLTATEDNVVIAGGAVDAGSLSSTWNSDFTERWDLTSENSTGMAGADAEPVAGSITGTITWDVENAPAIVMAAYEATA